MPSPFQTNHQVLHEPPVKEPRLTTAAMHYTHEQRMFALKCLWGNRDNMTKAAKELRDNWPKAWGRPPPHPAEFIQRQADNLTKHGTLDDAPRSGPHLKLDAELCEVAAELFKTGYYRPTSNPDITEWHGFNGITEALDMSPPLKRLQQRTGVEPRTLLRRILSANPEIRKYRRDYRRKKTPDERRVRQSKAQQWCRRERAQTRTWLKRQVYLDEGTIDLENAPDYTMKEYMTEDDERVRTVLTMPLPKVKTKIRLCFYIAVNPMHGGICLYPTTGTTGLQRRYMGIRGAIKDKFKVSALHGRGHS